MMTILPQTLVERSDEAQGVPMELYRRETEAHRCAIFLLIRLPENAGQHDRCSSNSKN
jgi:hypothetical protein